MKTYCYIAILQYDKDGISIWFPDFPEAFTCASSIDEVGKNAEEVLRLTLRTRIKDNEIIPLPTELKALRLENNQYTSLIRVSLEEKTKFDKKTLTIPHELNVEAEKAGINFSQALQSALKQMILNLKIK